MITFTIFEHDGAEQFRVFEIIDGGETVDSVDVTDQYTVLRVIIQDTGAGVERPGWHISKRSECTDGK